MLRVGSSPVHSTIRLHFRPWHGPVLLPPPVEQGRSERRHLRLARHAGSGTLRRQTTAAKVAPDMRTEGARPAWARAGDHAAS